MSARKADAGRRRACAARRADASPGLTADGPTAQQARNGLTPRRLDRLPLAGLDRSTLSVIIIPPHASPKHATWQGEGERS